MTDVRELTQAEFDGMVSGQQKFFMDLISSGRARIVQAKTPAPEPVRKDRIARDRSPGPLDRLQGKNVRVILSDDRELEGTITEVSTFEIVVTSQHSDTVVIMKHAIITVRELPEVTT